MLTTTATLFAIWSTVAFALPSPTAQSSLADLALQKVLFDASPIFGLYTDNKTSLSTWMSQIPDDTKVIGMNIPGTHDMSTWNWTNETLAELTGILRLEDELEAFVDTRAYRCQELSYMAALNNGIRIFDIRTALDITNETLVTYHGPALQSQTATVQDLMYGFYKFLDDHPSEAIFVSLQYEAGTTSTAEDDAAFQTLLYNMVTNAAAKKYILQTQNQFGTLGEARGKVTLLRRFDLNELPPQYEAEVPGVHFSPNNWTDNDPSITFVYNTEKNLTAHIEDFYNVGMGNYTLEEDVKSKYDAVQANLMAAMNDECRDLYWTWASSEALTTQQTPQTPQWMATGDGDTLGVNDLLVPFFQAHRGKCWGWTMFDFFDVPGDLITTFLDL